MEYMKEMTEIKNEDQKALNEKYANIILKSTFADYEMIYQYDIDTGFTGFNESTGESSFRLIPREKNQPGCTDIDVYIFTDCDNVHIVIFNTAISSVVCSMGICRAALDTDNDKFKNELIRKIAVAIEFSIEDTRTAYSIDDILCEVIRMTTVFAHNVDAAITVDYNEHPRYTIVDGNNRPAIYTINIIDRYTRQNIGISIEFLPYIIKVKHNYSTNEGIHCACTTISYAGKEVRAVFATLYSYIISIWLRKQADKEGKNNGNQGS